MTEPQRFIYTQADMEEFKKSSARRELLSFATAMGRSCTATAASSNNDKNNSSSSSSTGHSYDYDPSNPLVGLSPGMASLHGSLRAIASTWLKDIPPDRNAKARFGNPAFRSWHGRLVERSDAIIRSILNCHRNHHQHNQNEQQQSSSSSSSSNGELTYAESVLELCSEAGYAAATTATTSAANTENGNDRKEEDNAVVTELREYLHAAFGHPVRLDYGTGHESSFLVFLLCLCKIGCFGSSGVQHGSGGSGGSTPATTTTTTPKILAPVALTIFSQYLEVTRGLQTDYMLEPAGSHGVWGLDDYHCLPFYFGACQFIHSAASSSSRSSTEEHHSPSCIHNNDLLRREGDKYMYLGCIRYIKSLKKGVPFFESSPMLDDISHIPSWTKVSTGLLRLYEGEVLDKLPVVQHFVFGNIFKATWKPSEKPREAPTRTFINGPNGDECIAPWAQNAPRSRDIEGGGSGGGSGSGMPPPTRAPWAK